MKVGDVVQHCLSKNIGLVLEVRTCPSMTTEVRVLYSQSPQLLKHFSNVKFFEVISEAE